MKRTFLFSVLTVIFLTAACTQTVSVSPTPSFRFWEKNPIRVEVQTVVMPKEASSNSVSGRDINSLMPVGPVEMVRSWTKNRLSPTQRTQRVLKVTVVDAKVSEEALEVDESLLGYFKIEQAEEYSVDLVVRFDLESPFGKPLGHGQVTLHRSQTLPENASLLDRETALVTMIEELSADFDVTAESLLRDKLKVVRSLPKPII